MIIFLLLVIVAILLFGPHGVLLAGGGAIVFVVIGTTLGVFGWQAIFWTFGAVSLGAAFVFARAHFNVRKDHWPAEHHSENDADTLTRMMSSELDRQARNNREIERDRLRALQVAAKAER